MSNIILIFATSLIVIAAVIASVTFHRRPLRRETYLAQCVACFAIAVADIAAGYPVLGAALILSAVIFGTLRLRTDA